MLVLPRLDNPWRDVPATDRVLQRLHCELLVDRQREQPGEFLL